MRNVFVSSSSKVNSLLGSLVVGALGLVWMVPRIWTGMAISSDSYSYVGAAGNLLEGRGLLVGCGANVFPLTHFGPLTSLGLFVPLSFGADWLLAAKLLSAISYFALVAGLFYFGKQITGSGLIATLLAVFVGVHPTLVPWIPWVHSEALASALLVGMLYLVVRYILVPTTKGGILLGLLVAAAILARYAYTGFALGAFLSTTLLLRRFHREIEWKHVLLPWYVSAIPLVAWALRNMAVAGKAASPDSAPDYRFLRNVFYVTAALWRQMFAIDFPGTYLNALILIPVGAVLWLAVSLTREAKTVEERTRATILFVAVSLFISYCATILVLRSSVAAVQLDPRMFSPLVVISGFALAGIVWLPSQGTGRYSRPRLWAWALGVVLLVAARRNDYLIRDGVRILPIHSADGVPSGTVRVGAGSGTQHVAVVTGTRTSICR